MAECEGRQFTKANGEFTYAGIVWNDYTTPEIVRRSETFEFLPSDICVCTFPRSGTTLTQEIVWHIVNKDSIVKGQKYGDIDERFPFLEFNYKFGGQDDKQNGIDMLQQQQQLNKQPRLIKTHCPVSMIGHRLQEGKPRVVAVARNPKDCCVSLFKFYTGLEMYGPWPGDFDEFFEMFMAGKTMCGDYFKVVADLWQMRSQPNVLFITYEDIVKRPTESITRIAEFLGHSLTAEQLDCITHNCRFDSMYNDDGLNIKFGTGFRFLRKGIVGDWRSQLSSEQSDRMDEEYVKRLKSIGLEFEFE